MKIPFVLITTFFCIFHTVSLTAQDFIPLENSSYKDYIEDIKELDNGNFIYVQTYLEERDPQKLQELLVATDSIFTTVKLVDESFQLLAEFPIKTDKIFETLSGVDVFLTETGFLISGFAYAPNGFAPFRKVFLIELDHDLNEISKHVFAHAANIFWITNPIINYDGNIVYVGMYDQLPAFTAFLVEYSLEGELLNLAEFPASVVTDFVQLPDSSYNVYHRLANNLSHLPADWSSFSEEISFDFGEGFNNNNGHQLLDDSRWLFSGISWLIDSTTQAIFGVSQAAIINPDNTVDVIYQNRPPEDASVGRGIHVMDMVDTTCIYFSSVFDGCFSFEHPGDSCFNFISIHNIQIDGTENWTQYLGFDAAYHPIRLITTQDEGVLLLVYRFSPDDNMKGEGDMYFIKLDKDGNVESPVNTEEEESPFIIQQFLVYPNPARDLLRYTFSGNNISSPIVKIFDTAGRLLLTDEINDKETDISGLVPGYYFYEILDKGKRVQTGKLVKE